MTKQQVVAECAQEWAETVGCEFVPSAAQAISLAQSKAEWAADEAAWASQAADAAAWRDKRIDWGQS